MTGGEMETSPTQASHLILVGGGGWGTTLQHAEPQYYYAHELDEERDWTLKVHTL